VRVPPDELAVDPVGHLGQGEPALLLGDRRVEGDLEQRSPSSSISASSVCGCSASSASTASMTS
jgi:hypothetical protein